MAMSTVSVVHSTTQPAPLWSTVGAKTEPIQEVLLNDNGKPYSKSMQHHFSTESKDFSGSSLKKLATRLHGRKVIPLGTGRPTPDFYPWESLTVRGIVPHPLGSSATGVETADYRVTKHGSTYNLSNGLNYGPTVGSPSLVRFLTEHVEIMHHPSYADWRVSLTSGSTAALEIAFRIFCNRGDTVLAEQFTYPGAIEGAKLLGLAFEGVEMDVEGLRPAALQRILREWDLSRGPKPRVLYTVPTGQNPTGATQSTERRRAIYGIAEEHDLIIIEDDPYYFLRMGVYPPNQESTAKTPHLPSYLSLDRSGRVVRLDSAAKILAPGLRTGWVTASAQIIEKFIAYQEITTVEVNGPSQLMLWSLLDQTWGHQGFSSWLDHISSAYRTRRDALLRACDQYLPRDICAWDTPEYGMFLWLRLNWARHPLLRSKLEAVEGEELLSEVAERINNNAIENGVQVTKGLLFTPNQQPNGELQFRLTFAAAPAEEFERAVKALGDAVRQEFSVTCE
ncbi:L-kynurenine/alpha-aminoadipate aminotransferase [Aspergillus bombycis]|uniref:L-kynurenine/alpha-aminoadipate aminotransferase n=1 Tax=Aspergillus bombycis TaxID=109264 RepID=A0A1F8AI73_9EURO|nr:L-kynurenine/alpha-aminoadipate aminotransferase [Aspergillus bombycis]OGM51139.1 L-kynurenine/alpha-aminoadipate aminotransferase [Aspergillus bombycis]